MTIYVTGSYLLFVFQHSFSPEYFSNVILCVYVSFLIGLVIAHFLGITDNSLRRDVSADQCDLLHPLDLWAEKDKNRRDDANEPEWGLEQSDIGAEECVGCHGEEEHKDRAGEEVLKEREGE